MALTSKDDDNPPKFWGGRESLVVALGRALPDPDDDSEDASRERNAAFRAVRAATTLLTKRGAIGVFRAAGPHHRQEWTLNLTRTVVHEKRAPVVHEKRAERCTKNVLTVHEKRAPKEEEEDRGLTTGEMKADLRYLGTGSAHTRERNDEPDSSTVTDHHEPTCPDCGTVLDPGGACFMCQPSTTWAPLALVK
jgi:hypothetical protein